MKKLELYLWIAYSFVVFLLVPAIDFYFLNMSGAQAASQLAFPILVWIVLSAYYLLRWVVRKRPRHQNSIKTAEKLT